MREPPRLLQLKVLLLPLLLLLLLLFDAHGDTYNSALGTIAAPSGSDICSGSPKSSATHQHM